LEHSHILGDTIEKIAFEKSGIIKKNVPVYIGDLPISAVKKIESICDERESNLVQIKESIENLSNGVRLKINENNLDIVSTGLTGDHQIKNAALAIKTISEIIKIDNLKNIYKGLDNIVSNTGIQGRYEKTGRYNNVILDAAHNLEGIEIFLAEFKKELKNYNKCTLIFGAMRDKEISEMLKMLNLVFSQIFVTSSNYERAATSLEIKQIADSIDMDVKIEDSPEDLIEQYKNKRHECLVVLGSIYLLGEIKQKISNKI
jgi:dihydrofolate synthase/folylpolyglutamate synthase